MIKCDTACTVGLQALKHLYKCYLFLEYLVKTIKLEISTRIHQGQVYLVLRAHMPPSLIN